jgi:predicted O-methyltransferase YrrM
MSLANWVSRRRSLTKQFEEALFKLPKRSITEIFPGIDNVSARLSLAHIPDRPDMVMPLKETLVIAAICQWLQPRRAFEIGTYTGTTTLAIAMNSPEDAKICTLDLPSQEDGNTTTLVGSAYRETAAAKNVNQLYGDSSIFDFQPYHGAMDLVLVDGNHQYEFAKVDSANALRMTRPGGVIIWDDYLWDEKYPECAGVTRCLDELIKAHDIANIADTRLAICCR